MNPELRSAFDKILALEPTRLPPGIQEKLLSPPLLSFDVARSGLGFVLANPAAAKGPAPQSLMPKLGIKSWRDGGSLKIIYDGVPLAAGLEWILAHPTPAQRSLVRAWLDTSQPLKLHLSAYVDFTNISEARFLAGPREVRAVSQCCRGSSAASMTERTSQLYALAAELVVQLPPRNHLIDLACLPDGTLHVLEINPGLTPRDLKALG